MNSETELTLSASKTKWTLILIACAVFVAFAYRTGPEGLGDNIVLGMKIPGETMRIIAMVFFGAAELDSHARVLNAA